MFAADSSYLIALFLKNDEHSKRARELYEQIKYEKILINFTIINEVMNSFKKKNYEEYYNIVRSSMGPKKYSHISNKLRTAKKEIIDYLDYSVIKWKDYFDVVRISLFLYINEDNIN